MTIRSHLASSRILAVFRLRNATSDPVTLAEGLVAAGVTALECTMDSPDALDVIGRLRRTLDSSVIIGAGTVTEAGQVDRLASIGVTFVVSPHTDEALITRAMDAGLEAVPGVLTPSDVQRARTAGASILKLFPAAPMGVEYFRALREPFSDVDWIPTGGLSLDDASVWLKAGALCVGVGSALWNTPNPEEEIRQLLSHDH